MWKRDRDFRRQDLWAEGEFTLCPDHELCEYRRVTSDVAAGLPDAGPWVTYTDGQGT
jgi:hypothetical protein